MPTLEEQVKERISPYHMDISIFDGQFQFTPESLTDFRSYYGMSKENLYSLLLTLKNNGTLPSSDVRLELRFSNPYFKTFEDCPPWENCRHEMFLMDIRDWVNATSQKKSQSYWSAIFHLKWKDRK